MALGEVTFPKLDRFSFQVTVHIKEEDVPKFFEHMAPVFKVVTAEPELLYFEIFQDPASPGTISWVENWEKSPESFMTENMSKDYYKPYLAATEPMFIKPREFKILKRVGPPYIYHKPENFK